MNRVIEINASEGSMKREGVWKLVFFINETGKQMLFVCKSTFY